MFEDSERQLHQFTRGGAQGGHFGFAPGEQTLVQGLDVRVMAGRHGGSHVQRRPDARRTGYDTRYDDQTPVVLKNVVSKPAQC